MESRSDLSRVHVVIPARGAGVGKSRLGEALDPEERAELVLGMLLETLRVVDSWTGASAAHLVTGDLTVRAAVAKHQPDVEVIDDVGSGGLNDALREGRSAAIGAGATAVLFLPADLPLVAALALDRLLEAADAAMAAGSGAPVVVIAPSDARVGTNALLLSPPAVIEPQFGERSLEAHLRSAAMAEASVQLVRDHALGFDLDTPDDLERLEFTRLVELQAIGQAALDALRPGVAPVEVV